MSAAAGPFDEVNVSARLAGRPGPTLPLTLAGRATPGGPVDDLVIQSGHWARGPGQVVLSSSDGNLPPLPLGTELTVTGAPGTLTVVGMAASVTGSADGWVTPATAAALHPVAAQMLYRFRSAGTAAAVRADVAAVAAALPPHTVGSALSWLTVRAEQESGIAPIAPFLIAFGVTGLVLSVLIVINVVSGAVLAGYPPDRHPEKPRLHARAGRGGLHQPGHDPGRGRAAWPGWSSGTCWPGRCWAGPPPCTGWPRSACRAG